jgi:hypothetical protein
MTAWESRPTWGFVGPVEKIMNRFVVALAILGFLSNTSSAVDIKNVRPCYGPLGPTRIDPKCLPGDILFFTYEIDGLALDPKTHKCSYETILELLDAKDKVLFRNPTPVEWVPQLGGTTMPGDLHVVIGEKRPPGKYKVQLTIRDKIGKNAKAFVYEFDVVPEAFGLIHVAAPALGVPGQHHVLNFKLANLTLDAKTKQPDAELTVRILDEKKKQVSEPTKMILPRDMPEGTDLQKLNAVPFAHPVLLNRAGRFYIEVLAHDKNANKRIELRYHFTVLDISNFANK